MTEIKLTLDLCRKLCKDFRLSTNKDGKKGCHHLQDNREMCNLPSHFVCELVLHKHALARKEKMKGQAVSASRIGVIECCPRAYAMHYLHHLDPDDEAAWKRIGHAFGVARARYDVGLDVDLDALRSDLLPYERAMVRAALRLYRLAIGSPSSPIPYRPREVTCEEEVLFELHGLWWLGFADAVSLMRDHIYEWKFARTDYDLLTIARQAAVYFHGIPEAKSFTLCIMRKPGQRPGKHESELAFENRIFGEMCSKPEEWIRHFTIERDQLDVDGVLRESAESFRHSLAAGEASSWAPHYSSCDDCDYRPICVDQIGKSTDYVVQLTKKKRGL